jgi:hypothetical protein
MGIGALKFLLIEFTLLTEQLQHSNDQVISVREYCPTHAAIASNLGARDGEV